MIALKTKTELARMADACRISAEALARAGEVIAAGMTTKELDTIIREYILSCGAKPSFLGYGGFKGSACISINDEVIHGIPSAKRVLNPGDIVSVDVGAYYRGYHGDNAYTYRVGEVMEEADALLSVTEAALYRGIAAAQPGNRIGDISAAVQGYVEAHGMAVVRQYVGHGVGQELHEDPEVPNFGRAGHGPRLLPGMTIAIEPMVNAKGSDIYVLPDGWTVKTKSGSLSAHFEHTVAITANGPQILTKV